MSEVSFLPICDEDQDSLVMDTVPVLEPKETDNLGEAVGEKPDLCSLLEVAIDNVVIDASGSFLIQKTQGDNKLEYSILKEIKGVTMVDIMAGEFRSFCVKVDLKGQG